jgi:hypothetical protein
MSKLSPTRWLVPLATALLVAACAGGEPQAGPNVRGQLAEGRRSAAEWIATSRVADSIGAEQAVALGYLERLRLGLGGPFRLIDYARQDPRLGETTRTRLAWALLARTAAGAASEIEPALLGGWPAGAGGSLEPDGRAQLELLQRAIVEATDPRAGELAVRLGYALAAAEGTLSEATPRVAARIAALTRDRELARTDARSLLDSARVHRADAIALLARWRAERRFASEAPFIAPLPGTLERQALELAPRLAASLRELAMRRAAEPEALADSAVPRPAHRIGDQRSLITPAAARVLAAAADSLGMPPLAPVSVALRGYLPDQAAGALAGGHVLPAARLALAAATTEEALVARFTLLRSAGGADQRSYMALLWTAAGLRMLAQEPVWYPGYGGPSARELEQRYGLAAVTFDEGVPATWRPYYRGLIASAIEDMRLVLPALDLSGLRVRFDARPAQAGTLALHDPHARRLLFSPASVAGTIAHEIAHDLDWQVALRRYRVRGDYATDRVMRYARGRTTDRLALQVQDLFAGVSLPQHTSKRMAAHARRPAEVFARNIDWFVAVALAGTGRMNGYLTSVQDELLTGYGTVRPPELSGTAGDALVRILDVIAPVYPDTRAWFLRHYGTGRDLRSYDLVRGVLEAELPEPGPEPFAADRWQGNPGNPGAFASIAAARDHWLESVQAWSCRLPSSGYDAALERARRQLVLEAAGARARGLARERARRLADPAALLRLARELYGEPVGTQQLTPESEEFVRQLAAGVRRVEQQPMAQRADGFRLLAAEPVTGCSL